MTDDMRVVGDRFQLVGSESTESITTAIYIRYLFAARLFYLPDGGRSTREAKILLSTFPFLITSVTTTGGAAIIPDCRPRLTFDELFFSLRLQARARARAPALAAASYVTCTQRDENADRSHIASIDRHLYSGPLTIRRWEKLRAIDGAAKYDPSI